MFPGIFCAIHFDFGYLRYPEWLSTLKSITVEINSISDRLTGIA